MTGLQASVVICVYTERRWEQIVTAIETASAQPGTAEVIVVVDHNNALLQRLERAHVTATVVPNAHRQGLSGARNTGVEVASAPLVAFLDDDAAAEPEWLRWLLEPFDSDLVECVGGRAVPEWQGGAPARVLPPELLWVVGCTFTGQPTELATVRNVMGCSMLFRRSTLMELGGFDVDTGRVGRIPLGGEETDLCIRLLALRPAAEILFEPRSLVRHTVSADRLGWRYLVRRGYYEGVSKAVLADKLGQQQALESERAYVRSVLPRGVWRELRSSAPGGRERAVAIVVCLAVTALGYLRGSVAVRRTKRASRSAASFG